MKPFPALFFAALAAFFVPSRVLADLIVDSWYLTSGVSSSSSQEFAWSDVVQNPYQQTLVGTLADSYTSTTLNLGWTGDSAHFDLTTSHYAQQLEGFTLSEGQIYVTPAVDSIITAQGTWQFAWPNAAEGDTYISLLVADAVTYDEIALDGAYGGNFDLGPPHGTLNVQDSGLLLAGRLYEVHYFTRIYFHTPTPPGTYGEASGEIHFSIVPVPESATLGLMALALPIASRTYRRHRRTRS